MKAKKLVTALVLIGVLSSVLAGCGTKDKTTSGSNQPAVTAASDKKGTDTAKVEKIRVAVANDFNPYAYLDEKGDYIGYEVDVLKKVDELLPQYEFEYQTVADQFVALTSNKVDLISHQWESNPERQKTYLFGKEIVTTWAAYIITKDGAEKLQTYKELEGKTVATFQGSNDAYQLETYNKEHNNAIKLEYNSGDFSVILSKLESGAVDAFLLPLSYLPSIEEGYKVKLQRSDEPSYYSGTYFIYRRDDADETALQEAVDGVLKTLHEDGTLEKLSTQWLGADYTVEPEDQK
ncbi:transporter substrate-binding domain-containing protein [Anaerocolumna xylanovorans]|uniref:L-cystine transport system substrate-binding protein n=1 Tax=Anaerocolumna xylanovorans DSM 12503 TaxID=1121345 RepID=A0A1M7XX08_9FIRM|nr:transporter substrate-binding domain-containing protein [Anaerocolumna xylanovorans]SHO43315.1 L-cystine transport system substrate-binding protein [Anaerocolumna xylanovorans DSM 12503]